MSRLVAAILALPMLLIGPAPQSAAQDAPDPAPILRIDSEQHQAPIHDIALSPDGGIVATAGDDKTIRLWDFATGELVDTMRIPIGEGSDGILYSLAFSPSGRALLAGGISGISWGNRNFLYLLRPLSAEMGGRLPLTALLKRAVYDTSGGDVRFALALSASGRGTIEVRDQRGQVLFEDSNLGGSPDWIEFGPDGSLVTASDDGTLRVYDRNYQARQVRLEGQRPANARFSPDGSLIAVGYFDRRTVDVLDAASLQVVGQFSGQFFGGVAQLNAIAWRGSELLAAGGLKNANGDIIVRRWSDLRNPNAYEDLAIAEDAVTRLEATPGGEVLFATGDPVWGVIGTDFQIRYRHLRPGPDFRNVFDGLFSASADGRQIAFQFDQNGEAGDFIADLTLGRIDQFPSRSDALKETDQFLRPIPPQGIENWRGSLNPTWNGRPLELSNGEKSQTVSRLADGGFVIGGDRGLHVFDIGGGKVARRDMNVSVWGVLGLPDGRFVGALGDGTIRFYRITPGRQIEETGALYLARPENSLSGEDRPGTRWLAWLPDGRFAHSDNGGQDLAGYHVNHAANEMADWLDFAQVYSQFYDPETVLDVLAGAELPPPPAPPTSGTGGGIQPVPAPTGGGAPQIVVTSPPPEIELVEFCLVVDGNPGECHPAEVARRGLGKIIDASADADTFEGGIRTVPAEVSRILLRFTVTKFADGLSKIDVFNNGRSTGNRTRGLGKISDAPSAPDDGQPIGITREVLLLPGMNELEVRAYDNRDVYGVSPKLALLRREPGQKKQPNLHALIIGANSYSEQSLYKPLEFATPDAMTVERLLRDKQPETYGDLTITTLLDDAVTPESLNAAFSDLAARVSPEDSVVVYFAGHGTLAPDGAYHFITPGFLDERDFGTHTLDQDSLINAVGSLQVQNLMLMLDTCYAGDIPTALTGRISNETGYVVVTASASYEEALDGYNEKNGVFAHALVEALGEEKAEFLGFMNADQVAQFLAQRVPQLALEKTYEQKPKSMIGNLDQQFPIAQADQ